MPNTDTRERRYPGAATGDEARFFAELHGLVPLSDTIKTIEFRFGEDSDDSPAVWITIHASADVSPSKKKIVELNQAGEKLRLAVLNSRFTRWPYVEIKVD